MVLALWHCESGSSHNCVGFIIYNPSKINSKYFSSLNPYALPQSHQQVQNYKTCLKNSHFGVEKFNFSLGLSFNFFCMDIILLSI